MAQLQFSRLTKTYEQIFSVKEIVLSTRLKCIFIVSWFICFIDFLRTAEFPVSSTRSVPVCWPYWMHCADQYHFDSFPYSYHYTTWNSFIFALLTATIWFFYKKQWNCAHFCFMLVILWKVAFSFVLTNAHRTTYELFHLVPSLVLLFSGRKMQGLRYTWSLLCLLYVGVRLDEGWIVGTYFSSLKVGVALVPKFLTFAATNAVLLLETICSVGLLSRDRLFGKFSFWTWTCFHIYSVTTLGFIFPIRCLGFLWAIFAFPEKEAPPEIPERAYLGWQTVVLSLFLIIMSSLPFFISSNVFETFEGMDYGFFTANSNYQCLNTFDQFSQSGEKTYSWKTGGIAGVGNSCYPQDVVQDLWQTCHNLGPQDRIAWKSWQSRNGGPFYELINEANACTLQYKAFSHNDWIHPSAKSPEVGYPKMSSFYYNNNGNRWPYVQPAPVIPPPHPLLLSLFPWLQKLYLFLWGIAFLVLLNLLFLGRGGFLRRRVSP